MTRYRTVRLVLHLGKHNTHYALLLRTVDGRDTTDRRLTWGQLPLPSTPDQPHDLLPLLQRVVSDLVRRHEGFPAAGGSGAPGGGGGRPVAPGSDIIPLHVVPDPGQPLDETASED